MRISNDAMNNLIKISVIIPIYNAEGYIRTCLESVMNQTYKNLEIICINDGSQDFTGDILNEYAKADSRFIVVHRKNGGVVSARKEGVKLASGRYVCYVDADDWIAPEMYMTMYEEGIKFGVDMVSVGISREFSNGKSLLEPNIIPRGIYRGDEIKKKILPKVINTDRFFEWGLSLSLCHYAFKKDLLFDNQLAVDDRIQMGEDTACGLFCLCQCSSIALIDQCFYHYRQSDSSMKRTSKYGSLERCRILYHMLNLRAEFLQVQEDIFKKIVFAVFFELLLSAYPSVLLGKSFLFPFRKVRRGKTIVLYGAGILGEEMYETVRKSGFCKIAGWVDSNYEAYQGDGMPVSDPMDIINMEFDYVVIAITNPEYREVVIQKLREMNVPIEKIADIDMTVLIREMLPEGFCY